MPILCYHGCLYPATTDARTLLPWMPVFRYHGCLYSATTDAHILLPWMPATLALTEGGNSTNSVIGPSRLVATASCFLLPAFRFPLPASCFLTSMRHWAHSPVPTILGIQGSLRCVISLLISWESQLTSAHLHTGQGHYRSRDPFGGSAQIATCILPMQTFSYRTLHNSAMQSLHI